MLRTEHQQHPTATGTS